MKKYGRFNQDRWGKSKAFINILYVKSVYSIKISSNLYQDYQVENHRPKKRFQYPFKSVTSQALLVRENPNVFSQ